FRMSWMGMSMRCKNLHREAQRSSHGVVLASLPETNPAKRSLWMRSSWIAAFLMCGVLAASVPSFAADDSQELAKKLNNPISNLVSLPVQFNWEFGEGPDEDTWEITNIQPVVPFPITKGTNMIARLIMPTVNRPGSTEDGDMTFSLFFSPNTGK